MGPVKGLWRQRWKGAASQQPGGEAQGEQRRSCGLWPEQDWTLGRGVMKRWAKERVGLRLSLEEVSKCKTVGGRVRAAGRVRVEEERAETWRPESLLAAP